MGAHYVHRFFQYAIYARIDDYYEHPLYYQTFFGRSYSMMQQINSRSESRIQIHSVEVRSHSMNRQVRQFQEKVQSPSGEAVP